MPAWMALLHAGSSLWNQRQGSFAVEEPGLPRTERCGWTSQLWWGWTWQGLADVMYRYADPLAA